MTDTEAGTATGNSFPIKKPGTIHKNTSADDLIEQSLQRGEGKLTDTGALSVETGAHTGRAARDKYFVRDATTEDTIWWDNNQSMSPEHFEALLEDFLEHADGRELFEQELFAGADENHRLPTRVVLENAWHALFIHYLLRRPDAIARAAEQCCV